MGSTACSVQTPIGKIDIRSKDGEVRITRTRPATREEKISNPGLYNVVDVVDIDFPNDGGAPLITSERRQE
jgi:hypothetical protein